MERRVYITCAISLTAVLLFPFPAAGDQDANTTRASPFAAVALTPSELRNTNATGGTSATLGWNVQGPYEIAVILWDEAVPPRSQGPAPRPGKYTEIRQGGRLLMTTVTPRR